MYINRLNGMGDVPPTSLPSLTDEGMWTPQTSLPTAEANALSVYQAWRQGLVQLDPTKVAIGVGALLLLIILLKRK